MILLAWLLRMPTTGTKSLRPHPRQVNAAWPCGTAPTIQMAR
jgi:hypothetical protein